VKENNTLKCVGCNTRYPIIKGVPTLLDYHVKNSYRKLYRDINVRSEVSIYSRIFQNLDHQLILENDNRKIQQIYLNTVAIIVTHQLLNSYDLNEVNVLEVGSRRGVTLQNLSMCFPKSHLYGIDAYLDGVIEANAKKNTELYICGDVYNLPIKHASFDVVLSINTFHSFHEPKRFFGECNRVLKSQGMFMVADILTCNQVSKIRTYCEINHMRIVKFQDISDSIMRYIGQRKEEKVLHSNGGKTTSLENKNKSDYKTEWDLYDKLRKHSLHYCLIWCQKK